MKRGVLLLHWCAVVSGRRGGARRCASGRRVNQLRATEATLIADDSVADNTDVHAFVSPDKPNTVTIIANYIPFEDPAGGPNYYRFDPTVLYSVNVDSSGDGRADVAYQFRFSTQLTNPNTFLYNTGPIDTPSNQDANLSVKQTYTVTRVTSSGSTVLGSNLRVPPTNIGPRSNSSSYNAFEGVVDLGGNRKVFAGPATSVLRRPGLDLRPGWLRPFNFAALVPARERRCPAGMECSTTTHTIAIQVPKTDLRAPLANGRSGSTRTHRDQRSASPRRRLFDANGPQVQAPTRNPLINEGASSCSRRTTGNART